MTKRILNQLALLSILNNVLFMVIFQGSITSELIQNPKYIQTIEILWILSLTGLIILPTIMYTLLEQNKVKKQKFPLIAILFSIVSITFFAISSI